MESVYGYKKNKLFQTEQLARTVMFTGVSAKE